jgi:hypothetical protein
MRPWYDKVKSKIYRGTNTPAKQWSRYQLRTVPLSRWSWIATPFKRDQLISVIPLPVMNNATL